jgi:hypothetical protein
MGYAQVLWLLTPPPASAPSEALTRTPPLARRGEARERDHAFLSQGGAG